MNYKNFPTLWLPSFFHQLFLLIPACLLVRASQKSPEYNIPIIIVRLPFSSSFYRFMTEKFLLCSDPLPLKNLPRDMHMLFQKLYRDRKHQCSGGTQKYLYPCRPSKSHQFKGIHLVLTMENVDLLLCFLFPSLISLFAPLLLSEHAVNPTLAC